MREVVISPETIVKIPNVFGDGSDGDVTISVNTTLSRDMYYNNLTINSGIVLSTAGFRIFVKGTLNNNGTIQNNGANASGGTLGAGGSAGSTGGGGAGTAGSVASGANAPIVFNSLSADGGAGGAGQFTTGGAGGVCQDPPANAGSAREFIGALSGKLLGRAQARPAVILRKSANQSIPNNSATDLTWETEDKDTDSMHEGVTNPSRITINTPGLYLFNFLVRFAGNATGIRYVQFSKNAATVNASRFTFFPNSTNETTVSGSLLIDCAYGDYITIAAFQDSTVALNVIAAAGDWRDTQFQAVLLDEFPMTLTGGAGGGGAGGDGMGNGGGGGGGGGVVLIAANILNNQNGTLVATGGNGGNGGGGGFNCGGGGGGSGGLILLIYRLYRSGTNTVTGGAGGAKIGSGVAGTAGGAGVVVTIPAL